MKYTLFKMINSNLSWIKITVYMLQIVNDTWKRV